MSDVEEYHRRMELTLAEYWHNGREELRAEIRAAMHEPLTWRDWLGMVFAFAGLFWIGLVVGMGYALSR